MLFLIYINIRIMITAKIRICAKQNKLLSGGQDGRLVLWDMRRRNCISTVAVHSSARGRGAVAGIEFTSVDGSPLVVSSVCGFKRIILRVGRESEIRGGKGVLLNCKQGADSVVAVSDMRKGSLELAHRFTEHRDFIYSLTVRLTAICDTLVQLGLDNPK